MMAAELSRLLNMISKNDVERIRALYLRAGLPVQAPDLGMERYLRLMELDKKVEGGRMRFVLLKRIGEAAVHSDIPGEILAKIFPDRAVNA
jgi:3-dehydroquinate synthase